MKKLRIYITQIGHPDFIGGGNAAANNLAKFLTQRGHKVTCIYLSPRDFLSKKPDLNYEAILRKVSRSPIINCLRVFLVVRNLINNESRKPDVILSSGHEGFLVSYFPQGSIFIAASRNFMRFVGSKDFLRIRWFNPWRWGELLYVFSIFLDRLTKLRADCVQVLGEFGREETHNIYGIPRDKMFVVTNGVNKEMFPVRPMPKKKTILFGGGGAHYKGLDILISALPFIINKHPDTQLLVTGKVFDQDGSELRQLAEELKIASYISWPGMVQRSEMPNFFKLAYLLAVPSRLDSFPVIVLEAFSSGVPVVAAPQGALPEVITHRKNGLIMKPEDSLSLAWEIIYLLDNPQRAVKIGMQGRKAVEEKFSWGEVAKKFEEEFFKHLGD